jgi:3-deoxy-manno-octulosonate cytidylyltransferase (CMP-KDO synthetase)
MPKSFIVIPARLASTRLPRKLLLRETGKSLIQHTYEAARHARKPAGVCVATDHEEIFNEVHSFGGRAQMTSPDCASGTDRVAEVARGLADVNIVVNVQGDEPELAGTAIDAAVELLEADPQAAMSTLATPIRERDKLHNPACVKVVFDERGRALYFSRSPIPHAREWHDSLLDAHPPLFYQHIGLYAYRREFLLSLASLPPSRLEQIEKLEQLRVLEAGHSIAVAVVPHATLGIDTPHDYQAFVARCRQAQMQDGTKQS